MGILISKNMHVIVQGITGKQGSFHTRLMQEYGTKIVAGVTPGKGGGMLYGVPIYDTVEETLKVHKPEASIIFVPAPYALDAALEAIDSGVKTIVIITEHVPIKDATVLMAVAAQAKATIIGPNTPGVITPMQCKLGIMPAYVFAHGGVGVVSRSGTLTYEIAEDLTKQGIGQSTCLGIGGDPVTGLDFIDALKLFKDDPQTKAVTIIGEIGGNLEENAAEYIEKENYPKPVVAYIAGRFAPQGKRMGHAGAIITGAGGTAQSKIKAFERAGVQIAEKPSGLAKFLVKMDI